jgi:hypothetical protein
MVFGHGMGQVFLAELGRRDRSFVVLGLAMIASFIVLRYFNVYADPHPRRA